MITWPHSQKFPVNKNTTLLPLFFVDFMDEELCTLTSFTCQEHSEKINGEC